MNARQAITYGEYVGLRLVRKFIFTEKLLAAIGHWLPYYRKNVGEMNPSVITEPWLDGLARAGRSISGARVLEIGSGRTLSTGHQLVADGAAAYVGLEPLAPFDAGLDEALILKVAQSTGRSVGDLRRKVRRVTALDGLAGETFDIVLSNSVLEHVEDVDKLLSDTAAVLAPGGIMYHVVDYRDHFFKYPYHFLTFSKPVWDRFLNPGDLTRMRLGDHLKAAARQGLIGTVLFQEVDEPEFSKVADRISPDFDGADPTLAIMRAGLLLAPTAAPGEEASGPLPRNTAGPEA